MKFMIKVLFVLVFTLTASAVAFADSVMYGVSLDTSSLVGHTAAPFSLSFQLSDGAGVGNANNSVTLSGFNFGSGGSAAGSPFMLGGASGNVGSAVTLTDSSFLNMFTQQFTPGSSLSFLLSLTGFVEPAGIPDQFSFAILDGSGFELPYDSPFNAALVVDFSHPLNFQTFGTNPFQPPAGGGSAISMAAPDVAPVPEPGTFALVGIGICLLVGVRARRKGLILQP